MPVAWLHIGAGKCGSSLIQGLFNDAEVKSYIEPEYQAHLSAVIQSHTPVMDYSDYFIQDILDKIAEAIPRKDILFSCENLFGVMTHGENCYGESVKVIKHLFKDFDVKLLVFVRRQDTWLESMYGQDVKRQEIRSVSQYMDDVRYDNLHWDAMADAYSVYDLTVLPFESHVLRTNGIDSFVDGMCRWLGSDIEFENLPVINPTLSRAGLEVQMLANRVLPANEAYHLSTWLEHHCPKPPGERHDILEDRDAVLSMYRESNRRLFEKHMPDFSPEYYTE